MPSICFVDEKAAGQKDCGRFWQQIASDLGMKRLDGRCVDQRIFGQGFGQIIVWKATTDLG
jgi:hypothetical protein